MFSDSTQYGWVFALTAHSMGEEIMCFLTHIMGEESICSLKAHSMSEKGMCSLKAHRMVVEGMCSLTAHSMVEEGICTLTVQSEDEERTCLCKEWKSRPRSLNDIRTYCFVMRMIYNIDIFYQEELEVLHSIYEGDDNFKEVNLTTFQYKVRL